MARTSASPRLQRLSALAATALLAAVTAAAFGRIFTGHAAALEVLLAGLVSAAIAAALERRNLLLATIISAAMMVAVVGALVLPDTTWHSLPTLATLRAMADSAALVGQQARVQVAPTPPLRPLVLAAVTAIWAAIFSAHALAFRASSPLLALLPPVALLAFADTVLEESFRPGYGVMFLGAALLVVFVDGLRRVHSWGPVWSWAGSRRHSPAATRGAGRVAVGALTVATLAPLFLPGIGSKGVLDLSSSSGQDVIRIDPQVAVASALAQSTPETVFTVRTTQPSYYRMLALDRFDGNAWRADPGGATAVAPGVPLVAAPFGAPTIYQSFTVESSKPLSLPGVPVAFPPVRVDMPDRDLTYDQTTQSVYVDGDLEEGATYRVTSLLQEPSPLALDAYRLPDPSQLSRWTQLPTDPQMAEIHILAVAWTAGATTPYGKVLAILDHLSPAYGFRYDATVDHSDDAFTLLDFLTASKAGFCQQYASAMAVLLRSIGIPARVAIGFTPGSYDHATGRWTVTTRDAHSWVEVWFGDSDGWLAFEPTPQRANPVASAYADPASARCVLSGQKDCGSPSVGTGQEGSGLGGKPIRVLPAQMLAQGKGVSSRPHGHGLGGAVGGPGSGSFRSRARHLVLLALGLVGLAGLLMPPARALRRRRRLRRASAQPRRSILVTYDVFSERASALGHPRSPGETPDEYRARLVQAGPADGELELLTRLAVRAAYASADPGPTDAGEATAAAAAAIRELRRRTALRQRVLGAWRR